MSKNVEVCFLPEERSQMRVYLLLFFYRGDRIDTVVLECWESDHSNKN